MKDPITATQARSLAQSVRETKEAPKPSLPLDEQILIEIEAAAQRGETHIETRTYREFTAANGSDHPDCAKLHKLLQVLGYKCVHHMADDGTVFIVDFAPPSESKWSYAGRVKP